MKCFVSNQYIDWVATCKQDSELDLWFILFLFFKQKKKKMGVSKLPTKMELLPHDKQFQIIINLLNRIE